MKVFKLSSVIILIVLTVSGYYFRSDLKKVTDSIRSGQWQNLLKGIEESNLLPPPLRVELENRNAYLTSEGTFEWTNIQRGQNNLKLLTRDSLLDSVATTKLNDLFERQYFEHVSPTGEGPADLAESAGYAYVIVGENLALGNFKNDQELVEAWMNSPGHRENILNKRYTEIGIAVGKKTFEGKQVWIAVQSFGTPLSSCPAVNKDLKYQLDSNQAEITGYQSVLKSLKAEIDQYEKSDRELYKQKIAEYNSVVGRMNVLIDQTKQLVAKYNEQVNRFNVCIKQ